jgi:cytochrome P450
MTRPDVAPANAIPGPAGTRLTGNLADFSADPLGFLTRSAREYGDVVALGSQNVLLAAPDDIERLLVDRDELFSKMTTLTHRRGRKQAFPLAMMNNDGAVWRAKRDLLQPAFSRRMIAQAADLALSCCQQALDEWQPAEIRVLHKDVSAITLQVVTGLMFGKSFEQRGIQSVAQLVAGVMDLSSSPILLPEWFPSPTVRRIRRAMRTIDELLLEISTPDEVPDLADAPVLHALLSTTPRPSPQEMRDELATLVMSGYETTTDAVVWSCYLLARHPEAAERVAVEAAAAANRDKPVDRLDALPYTHAVVREAMRLYPPVWLTSRDAKQDVEFGGHVIPAGTTVTVSQWVTHRDERWFDDPETFVPERWIDQKPGTLPRGAYFPFGLGPRACIGASIAMTEAVVIVSELWRRFRLELADPDAVHPRPALALQPVGVDVRPRPR